MRLPKFGRSERGAAAVEFAIVLPLLFLLVFGIMDFGRAFFIKNNLVAAMREGARLAATQEFAANSTTPPDNLAAQKVVNYIQGTIGGTAIAPSAVSVVKNNATGMITVKLTNGYAYVPITPFAAQFGLANITLRDSATFRYERYDP